MMMSTVENIPQWAVCYIAYGDDSGITKEEKAMVDAFILSLNNNGWQICETPISGSENEFCRFPAFGDACATVDFEIYKN